jgi:hypothetical protein
MRSILRLAAGLGMSSLCTKPIKGLKQFRALRSMRTGRPRSQQQLELLSGQPLDRLKRVNLFNILVRTKTHDTRKAQRIAALVPV